MTEEEREALRAELHTILHRAGMFQLLEAVLVRAITPEEYAAELDRRAVVRTYPARVYWGTVLALVFAGVSMTAGVCDLWLEWGLMLTLACLVSWDVRALVMTWRKARKPEVTP